MIFSLSRYRFSSVFLFAGFLGAHSGAAWGQATPASPVPVTLAQITAPNTEKQRLEVFDQVWQTVNENYYDPKFNGVNWTAMREKYRPLAEKATVEAELYEVLDSMLEELNDAHTRVTPPQEQREVESKQETTTGLDISLVEHERVITGVARDSEAARVGIKVGMILKTVDGKTISDALRQAHYYFSRVMGGEPNTPISLGLVRADGTPWEVVLTRRLTPLPTPVFEAHLLPSGAAYIKFDHFRSPADKQVKAALRKFKNAPALVLDLRENGGGNEYVEEQITGYFFNDEVLIGKQLIRTGTPEDLKAGKKGGQLYGGPVAVLVAYDTASAAESFANTLQEQGRAQLFGEATSGSLLGVRRHISLQDGGELRFSEMGYISAKGRVIEGKGLILDRETPVTIADLQQGRDAALEAAKAYFAGLLKQPQTLPTPK